MITLLSPAKRMNEEKLNLNFNLTSSTPLFKDKTQKLADKLKKLDEVDLIEMMKVSSNIAKLNVIRYQNFDKAKEKMAIFLFQGDSYLSFDAKTLSASELNFAQSHLIILSGLYGMIRPLDAIKPYRLEMGTKLSPKVDGVVNLPNYWNSEVNKKLDEINKNDFLINLASDEYFQVVKPNKKIINIVFKQQRNAGLKTYGILAKKARGLMARYIIQNKIENPQLLKEFNLDGYKFISSLSDENHFVFIQ